MNDALADAQKRGYAEAKPDADVEGYDAQAKVVILAAALMGTEVPLAKVPCEGITGITPEETRGSPCIVWSAADRQLARARVDRALQERETAG